MKLFILTLLSLVFSSTSYANIGFRNGNDIGIIYLDGNLTAICPSNGGPNLYSYFNCAGYIAEPAAYDYFVHPTLDADTVRLTCLHEDGSNRTVKASFKSEKGMSSKSFNLAIKSLTQKPLLDFGKNKVSYELIKNNEVVKKGDFAATKKVTEERRCRPRTIYFSSESACRDQFYACDQYFNQEHNCR